jgi:hypothetical protein
MAMIEENKCNRRAAESAEEDAEPKKTFKYISHSYLGALGGSAVAFEFRVLTI